MTGRWMIGAVLVLLAGAALAQGPRVPGLR
jgi:hypothetical protein